MLGLHEDAEAGYFDETSDELIRYLISQLPEGYILDDAARVIRLDPDLPDHVFVTPMAKGVPRDGKIRIPARLGEAALPSAVGV